MLDDQIPVLLADLVAILVAARVFGWAAARIGQPPVVGEIVAGILAGPTILGSRLSLTIFPSDIRPSLTALANVGVALFMFVAGLETKPEFLSRARNSMLVVSVSAYVVPFLLGCGVALVSLSRYHAGSRADFVLYIGCALAVTAFPVLARILHDRKMFDTEVGQLALGSAAIGDILAWSGLAVIIAVARSTADQWRLLLMIPLVIVTWWGVRPLLARSALTAGDGSMVLVAVCGALMWGAMTEWAGLHLIFGAFLIGAIFPVERREAVKTHIHSLGTLLLPCFFVTAGLKVNLAGIDRAGVVELVALIATATLGKLIGAYVAARLTGIDDRRARVLAALLNTRGLTELILLNVGLSTGIIGQRLYSLLVVMALVTTAATVPLLNWFERGALPRDRAEDLEEASVGHGDHPPQRQAGSSRPRVRSVFVAWRR